MLALPFQRYHLVCYSKANYTVTNKPSQGAFLGAVGDRLHRHRQAFPWHPSQNTKGQTTLMADKPSFISDYTRGLTTPRQMSFPLPEHQETDYQGRSVLPWNLSQSTCMGTDYMKKTNWLKADQQISPPLGLL